MRAKEEIWRAMTAYWQEAESWPPSTMTTGCPGLRGGPAARMCILCVEIWTRAEALAVDQSIGSEIDGEVVIVVFPDNNIDHVRLMLKMRM
jgi:hypothetical protein